MVRGKRGRFEKVGECYSMSPKAGVKIKNGAFFFFFHYSDIRTHTVYSLRTTGVG